MSFPDLSGEIARLAPELRGRISVNEPLAPYTWFRVGGPAQILFMPADEADLAGDRGDLRKQLADVDARDVRGDRSMRPGDFGGRVRLQVEHVLVRRPTRKEDHDHRLM